MKLLILGAGGHGRAVAEVALATGQYRQIAFLDDGYSVQSCAQNVVGKLADYQALHDAFDCAFVALGNPALRQMWQERLDSAGYCIPVLRHPAACVSPSADLRKGTVVMPGAVVQTNVRCGEGCILSAGAIVDHDAAIEAYCHINAGAVVPSMSHVPQGTKVNYGTVWCQS